MLRNPKQQNARLCRESQITTMDADALIQSASAREELACDVYCQFQTFDADHSGHLGFRELGQALRQLFKEAGLKNSPDFSTLEESFGAADTDGDNKISLEEFVAWYNHTIEWTARLHAEEANAQEAKKDKPATTLGRTESKLVFDLKMHDLNQRTGRGNPGPDTPRSRPRIVGSLIWGRARIFYVRRRVRRKSYFDF